MSTAKRVERAAQRGFATRTEERRHRMRQRFNTAADAGEQLHAAFDWFRSSAHHDPDGEGLMRNMAQTLADAARAIERGDAL
jgi:hypothetical protein